MRSISKELELKNKALIMPVIVLSQFAGTSLWFAGNAVITDLQNALNLDGAVLSHITSAVQFGFIAGTLVFALLTISDRFSPSKVFFVCSIAGAIANLGVYLLAYNFASLLIFRILTGFFLAGIYPVGMKIAADHHEKGLGKSLGYLVGALVVGTAFPHLLKSFTRAISWEYVFVFTSIFAAVGGLLVLLLVPDGPYHKRSPRLDLSAFFKVFQKRDFRAAAFGYFGHMWEIYTFWAFVPVILSYYNEFNNENINSISFYSFLIIAIGGLACVIGGYLSQRSGSDRVAFIALLSSCLCCLISPFIFNLPIFIFITFLLIWGMVVVTDSPQFSVLVAQRAPKETVGTALTIVVSIGFAITIVSIQFVNLISQFINQRFIYLFLAIGPVLGLISMLKQFKREQTK